MKSIRQCVALLLFSTFALTAHADLQEGQAAPKLDATLIDGKVLTARQTEGKVVVQLFWATWCPICASELPEFQKLYDTYKPRDLEIIAVSLDRDPAEVNEFWRAHGYTFPVAMRSDTIRQGYGRIVGVPTLYIIDRKGIVRLKHLGHLTGDEIEAQIKALL
ncbi:MAG TPA: TlpA disulfide reductase family protein [Burkholderiales bacterium]|nr:TlpA disulfide reductase family protein [Burkholderiales bacterium]